MVYEICIYCKNSSAPYSGKVWDASGYRHPCDECKKKAIIARKYQMNLLDYLKLLDVQDNSCAVCQDDFTEQNKPVVDHCHDKGHVRGLLCSTCNTGLGMFKESKGILGRAIKYLDSHKFRVLTRTKRVSFYGTKKKTAQTTTNP